MLKERLISEARIQAARERFKKWPGPVKSKFTFNQWLELFGEFSNTFQNIAQIVKTAPGKKVSCTKEAIQQLYVKYFAPLFRDCPNGRSRRRFYYLEQQAVRAEDFSGAPEMLREVAKIASVKECVVERIPVSFRGVLIQSFSTRSLLINGKRCDICRARHIWMMPRGKRRYSRVNFCVNRLRKHKFLIVLQEVENYPQRVFVIPISILLRRWRKRKKRQTLYIPLKKYPVYHNRFRKLDVWQYLNGWHLLRNP